jgi:hypothetical protein
MKKEIRQIINIQVNALKRLVRKMASDWNSRIYLIDWLAENGFDPSLEPDL